MLVITIMLSPLNNVLANKSGDKTDLTININEYKPVEVKENETLIISLEVANIGETDEEQITIHLCIDQDNNIIETKSIQLLKAGESVNISMNWKTQSSNHTIIANVDPYDKIIERNETNNVNQLLIYVAGSNDGTPNTNDSNDDTPGIIKTNYGDNVKYDHLSNGITRATIPFPTIYNEENDQWEPADLDVYWNSETSEWQPKKSRMDVSFKNDLESSGLYRFEVDGSWVEYSLNEGKMTWENDQEDTSEIISAVSAPVTNVKEDEITYEGIFDNTSIKYQVLPFGVKEYFILDSPPDHTDVDSSSAVLVYTGELCFSEDLTIWVDGEDYTNKDFKTSGKIEFGRAGEPDTLFRFSRPFAYDSNPKMESYSDCFYCMKIVDGKIQFSVEIPADWLLSPDRIYPVFIDPTILMGYPSDDAKIMYRSPSGNYGSSTSLLTRNMGSGSGWAVDSLLKFDLSILPSGCSIQSSELKLYYYHWHDNNPAGRDLNCYRATSNWDEGTVTWNNQPSYASQITTSTAVPSSFGWMNWDVTDDVQGFADNDFSNYGWKITDETYWGGGNIPITYFYSKEYGSYTPEIVVEYTEGSGGVNWASLANGATLTFSSSTSNNNRPQSNWDNMHDENDGTFGYLDWHAGQWVKITFSGTKTIHQIKFYADQVGEHYIKYLRASDDTWVDVSGYMPESSDLQWYVYDFSPVEAKAIMYDQVGQTPVNQGSCKIYEFQAFGGSSGGSEYFEDFESEIGLEWSTYYSSTLSGRNTRSEYDHHGGSYCWKMDVTDSGNYNLNEFILHVRVSSATYLNLNFYTREKNDEKHTMPSSFTGHTNADGIAVSNDRVNWKRLWQYPWTVSDWEDFGPSDYPVDMENLISISGDVYIKFQQYDNCKVHYDGILWDDITLESDGTINIDYEFIMPEWGGAMVHSDPHLTDNIDLSPFSPSALSTEWSTYSETSYGRNERTYIPDQIVNEECNFWGMDVSADNHWNLNELILHVDVSSANYLNLNFKTREYGDEKHYFVYDTFSDHTNADGIAVSTDGINWHKLWQYPSSVTAWTPYVLDIGSKISINGDVYVKFQQYDNYMNHDSQSGSDGIVWDDINLETDGTITLNSGESMSSYIEDFELISWLQTGLPSENALCPGNGIVGNGEIAACPFFSIAEHNLVVYDYDGSHLWKSVDLLNALASSSSPMISIDNKIIMCDNNNLMMIDPYYCDDGDYLWISVIPNGFGTPFSPTITENGVILLPMSGNPFTYDRGAIFAYRLTGEYLGMFLLHEDFYVINSASVNGNRIYVSSSETPLQIINPRPSKLYSVDVDPDAAEENRLTLGWIYPFWGDNKASPVFIDGTLYFDVLNGTDKPEVHAVRDKLYDTPTNPFDYHVKWKKDDYQDLSFGTKFSMSSDPRGGVWYQENQIAPFQQVVNHMIYRLDTENDGNVLQEIDFDDENIMGEIGYRPLSVLQICGDETDPIMIVSANDPFDKLFVIAIDLTDEKLIWKVQINNWWDENYAGGQYTFLMDDNGENPRVLFGGYYKGVYALGI